MSNRIRSYITSLGIEKQREIPGRIRKQSVKDFHSLRHCFCYYAGLRGVPLPVVQSIVGHMTTAMTRHYQNHADREARRKGIAMMQGLLTGTQTEKTQLNSTSDLLRNRLTEFAQSGSEMQILQLNVLLDKLLTNEFSMSRPQLTVSENDSINIKKQPDEVL